MHKTSVGRQGQGGGGLKTNQEYRNNLINGEIVQPLGWDGYYTDVNSPPN